MTSFSVNGPRFSSGIHSIVLSHCLIILFLSLFFRVDSHSGSWRSVMTENGLLPRNVRREGFLETKRTYFDSLEGMSSQR